MARIAVSLPKPGPLTKIFTLFKPIPIAIEFAASEAVCAAKGVPFLEPLKPTLPADDQEIVLPFKSVIVTIVLLKVD